MQGLRVCRMLKQQTQAATSWQVVSIYPSNACQIIGLNRAVMPQPFEFCIPDAVLGQLKQKTVNCILRDNFLRLSQ